MRVMRVTIRVMRVRFRSSLYVCGYSIFFFHTWLVCEDGPRQTKVPGAACRGDQAPRGPIPGVRDMSSVGVPMRQGTLRYMPSDSDCVPVLGSVREMPSVGVPVRLTPR